jgi:hypothetical protein
MGAQENDNRYDESLGAYAKSQAKQIKTLLIHVNGDFKQWIDKNLKLATKIRIYD